MKIDTTSWKPFLLDDLFIIKTSTDSNMVSSKNGTAKYISATATNNGVGCWVEGIPNRGENTITLARNGSVGSAFYQSRHFFASPDDIRILVPKFKIMDKYIGVFLCVLIEKEKFKYAYGRKFGIERIKNTKILLPATNDNKPDFEQIRIFARDIIVPKLPERARSIWEEKYKISSVNNITLDLNSREWIWFRYDEIFDIKKGFYNKKPEHIEDGDIPFIGATDSNNGITSMCDLETIKSTSKTGDENNAPLEEKVFEPKCITVSNNGSVGYAFYQEKKFTCSHDINPLYLKDKDVELNKYIAMFLCTLIEKERYRWSYGRKWRPARMPDSLIKLPVDSNKQPDWQFMEDYIKSLPYSANI